MIPLTHDLMIWRGSTPLIETVLSFTDPTTGITSLAPLGGSTVLLTVSWRGGGISKTSADGSLLVNLASAVIGWQTTRSETLSLPLGRIATYTYETISSAGDREPYLTGFIVGLSDGSVIPPQANNPQVVEVVLQALQGAYTTQQIDEKLAVINARLASIESILSGFLAPSGALSGIVTGSGGPVGSLSETGPLTGGIPGSGSLGGSVVTQAPGSAALSGNVPGAGLLGGSASKVDALVGTVPGSGALGGALSETDVLGGTIPGSGALAGSMSTVASNPYATYFFPPLAA